MPSNRRSMETVKIMSETLSKLPNIQIGAELSKTRVPFGLKLAFKHRRARCFKCHSYKRYENPMAVCWECRNRFCYKHINCLQVNNRMKETEEVRHICDRCKTEHEYRTLE